MNNSEAFKKAHALTRATLRAGDDYRVTFGACLKQVKAEDARQNVKPAITLDLILNIVFGVAIACFAAFSVSLVTFLIVNTIGELAATMLGLAVITMLAGALIIMLPSNEPNYLIKE